MKQTVPVLTATLSIWSRNVNAMLSISVMAGLQASDGLLGANLGRVVMKILQVVRIGSGIASTIWAVKNHCFG